MSSSASASSLVFCTDTGAHDLPHGWQRASFGRPHWLHAKRRETPRALLSCTLGGTFGGTFAFAWSATRCPHIEEPATAGFGGGSTDDARHDSPHVCDRAFFHDPHFEHANILAVDSVVRTATRGEDADDRPCFDVTNLTLPSKMSPTYRLYEAGTTETTRSFSCGLILPEWVVQNRVMS